MLGGIINHVLRNTTKNLRNQVNLSQQKQQKMLKKDVDRKVSQ